MVTDLEVLREIFKDVRLHIGIGVITQTGLAQDASSFRVQVNLLPEEREVVCYMSFADVNDVTLPEVGDLVTVGFADGHPDDAHVLARYPSIEEPIPTFARSGHSVKYSRTGKKLYLGSDTKVGIGRPAIEPTEPLVLGNVLVTFLTTLLNDILNAQQLGQCAVGAVWLDPQLRVTIQQRITTYLQTASTNIISQIAFTERGV